MGGGIVGNFSSDPHIRYDRLGGRWFVIKRGGNQHAGLERHHREGFEQQRELIAHHGHRHEMHAAHDLRGFGNHAGDGGEPVDVEILEGFEVRLDAGTRRAGNVRIPGASRAGTRLDSTGCFPNPPVLRGAEGRLRGGGFLCVSDLVLAIQDVPQPTPCT